MARNKHLHEWRYQTHHFEDSARLLLRKVCVRCKATSVSEPSFRRLTDSERKLFRTFDANQDTMPKATYDQIVDAYCRGYTAGHVHAASEIDKALRKAQAAKAEGR